MKRTLIFFLLISNYCNSQNFVKIGDSILSEVDFQSHYKTIKQYYFPKETELNYFEEVTKNDSLIKNAHISVYMNKSEHSRGFFYLLNKPFPDFKLKDSNNITYTNSSVIDKSTLVCILSSRSIPSMKRIKALNSLYFNNKFNVIGFIKDERIKQSQLRKIKFPLLLNSSQWLDDNFKNYYTPTFLILDDRGFVTYLFPGYPHKNTKYIPVDEMHKTVFDALIK